MKKPKEGTRDYAVWLMNIYLLRPCKDPRSEELWAKVYESVSKELLKRLAAVEWDTDARQYATFRKTRRIDLEQPVLLSNSAFHQELVDAGIRTPAWDPADWEVQPSSEVRVILAEKTVAYGVSPGEALVRIMWGYPKQVRPIEHVFVRRAERKQQDEGTGIQAEGVAGDAPD